jgi:hypothetical protein
MTQFCLFRCEIGFAAKSLLVGLGVSSQSSGVSDFVALLLVPVFVLKEGMMQGF